MGQQTFLLPIKRVAEKCQRCDLAKTRTNVVFGEGSPTAKVMIVGEGPGAEEDQQGRPFVGRSGYVLDRNLKRVPVERSDIYITNIVKCRPPGNRNPEGRERAACSGWLRKQIGGIQPEIIIALGSVASKHFVPDMPGITRVHGEEFSLSGGMLLVPVFHPSFVLRNPHLESVFLQDLRTAFGKSSMSFSTPT